MSGRAAIYLRISSDRTGEALGVARQREDCEQLSVAHRLNVVEVCTDNDTSAIRSKRRPGFERLMELLDSGEVDTVIAWNFERVLKTRADQLRFIELGQAKSTRLVLVRGAELDMSTPGGRLLADILSSIARNETEVKSDRQRRANRQRAQAGEPHRARRAFGYEPDGMRVRETEAELIRDMVSKFLRGWTFREIAQWLNDEDFKSATGRQFTIKSTRDHITSKRNAGIRLYDGQDYDAVWEPIIDRETHQRVMAEVGRRSTERNSRSIGRRYLLTGLLYCGRCEQTMVGHAKKDPLGNEPRPKYVCPNYPHGTWCGNNTRLGEPLEYLVKQAVLYRLDSADLSALLRPAQAVGTDSAELHREQTRLADRLTGLLNDYTDGTLSKAEYLHARDRVRAELDGVVMELRIVQEVQTAATMFNAADTVQSAWESNAHGWRRRLLELLIERVVVHPSRKRPIFMAGSERFRFDPESIEIRWRA